MKDLQHMQFYLPGIVVKAIVETEDSADGVWRPAPRDLTTVCLFADVAGFTPLTEELCSFGPDGLEELSTNLNKYATQVVKQTTRAGGDVLKFAGDAIMALWPEVDANDPNDLLLRVQRAVQCALDIQLRLDDFSFKVYAKDENFRDIESRPDGTSAELKRVALHAKLGLGMGRLRLVHLGGRGDLTQRERFEYVALGPALMQAIESETVATPGQVVVSKDVWSAVGSKFVAESTLPKGQVVVKEWNTKQFAPWRSFDRSVRLNNRMERKLWKYVPNAVLPYLFFTQDDFWAPELRVVTTLFFDLALDVEALSGSAPDATAQLERVFYEIQGSVLAYEGTVNKFLVDDKGATLIVVFGLPPLAHEDDALRGVLTGLKVLAALSRHGLQGSVGIATGLAFCGIIGHATSNRREYSVIGDSVNLAARLMVSARTRKMALLVDRGTRDALPAGTVLSFAQATTEVKGKRKPVQCYQLSRAVTDGTTGRGQDVHQWQQTRLQNLASTYNVSVWATGLSAGGGRGARKQKQKTRRRPTRTNALNAEQMRELEAQQFKAMNDTRAFLERKRQNALRLQQQQAAAGSGFRGVRGGSSSSSLTSAHGDTPALLAASLQAAMTDDLDREGVPSSPSASATLARAHAASTSKGKRAGKLGSGSSNSGDGTGPVPASAAVVLFLPVDEPPAETRVNLAGGAVATVLDVMEGAIEAFAAQKLIASDKASPDWFDMFWLRDLDRLALRPNRLLSSIPLAEHMAAHAPPGSPVPSKARGRKQQHQAGALDGVDLRLQLVMRPAKREQLPQLNPTGPEYVRGRLRALQDEVFSGNGGRVVVLDGDFGVGKTQLVESYYLSREMSELEDDMFFGYARGNRFESGRNARQFSVLADLMSALLGAGTSGGGEGGGKAKKPQRSTDDVVLEAIKAARRAYGVDDVLDEDLHLLNAIMGTSFPGGSSGDDAQALAASAPVPAAARATKQTKKTNRFAKARNVQGADGRVNRVKQLGVLWGTTTAQAVLSGGGGDDDDGPMESQAKPARRGSRLPMPRLSLGRRASGRSPARAGASSPAQAPPSPSQQQLQVEARPLLSAQSSQDLLVADRETKIVIRLLAAVLGGLATRAPVTVIVDDAQDMDPFSWLVFLEVAERWMRANVLVVLLHRPVRIENKLLGEEDAEEEGGGGAQSRFSMFKPSPVRIKSTMRLELLGRETKGGEIDSTTALHRALLSLPSVEPLELQPRPGDTRDILLGYAGVVEAPDALVRFVQRKTNGNPKFVCDSLDAFLDAGLVVRAPAPPELGGSNAEVLVFPDEEFETLRVARALPVPVSVTAVAGALLDRMNLTQQLIAKVASILGEVFALDDIEAIFPVKELLDKVPDCFKELVEAGVFVLERADQALYVESEKERLRLRYAFELGWLDDVLRARMLNTQKVKLHSAKKRLLAAKEEKQKAAYMAQARGKLELRHEGMLQVRKDNARNLMKPWKPRFCRLHGAELVQFYDRDNPKRLEVIVLTADSVVAFDALGHVGPEGGGHGGGHGGGGAHPHQQQLFCFKITTDRWEKKGKLRTERRDFTLGCETLQECNDWVFTVQYAIDSQKLSDGGSAKGGSGKKMGAGTGRSNRGASRHEGESAAVSDDDDDGDDDDDENGSLGARQASRGVVEMDLGDDPNGDDLALVAPDPALAEGSGGAKSGAKSGGGGGKLKGMFRGKRGSAAAAAGGGASELGPGMAAAAAAAAAGGVVYGARLGRLTPEAFAAVAQKDALRTFWTQSNAPRGSAPPRVPSHSSEVYYECAEMALVSRTSLGHIDGYLLGKLKPFKDGHVLGLVTACAVLPWARRRGIARRLFRRFFAACKAKGCRFVRSNVETDSAVAIAFHRALKFEEDDEQSEWLKRAGDETKVSFLKDLNTTTTAAGAET